MNEFEQVEMFLRKFLVENSHQKDRFVMDALCILVKHPKKFLGAYRRRYNHCSHLTVKENL